LRVINCEPPMIQCLVNFCAGRVVQLEINGYQISPFIPGAAGAFRKLEHLTICKPTENFLFNTRSLPSLKYLSVIDLDQLELIHWSYFSILNFLKEFSTTLQVIILGPSIELEDYGTRAEWEADETVFSKVIQLSMRHPPDYYTFLQKQILQKFPNLEILELQQFGGNDGFKSKHEFRVRAREHCQRLGNFQVYPKLIYHFIGKVRGHEYRFIMDKEKFEGMDDYSDSSTDDDDSSDSSTDDDVSSSDSD